MTPKYILFLMLFSFFTTGIGAQKKYIDSSINKSKTDAENHIVSKASDKINSGIDNVFSGNMFKKKHKESHDSTSSAHVSSDSLSQSGQTVISIDNTDYQSLGVLADVLKSDIQVTQLEKSYSNGKGSVKISHKGTTDQLLDFLVKNSGNKFEVIEVNPGKVSLKAK